MGYSIYVKTRSEGIQKKFYDFLSENMKSFNKEVFGFKDDYYYLGTDLSYCCGKRPVGFDYNCSGGERTYIHSIVKWIAHKTKAKHYFWDDEKTPYENITVREEFEKQITSFINWQKEDGKEVTRERARKSTVAMMLGMYEHVESEKTPDEVIDWIDNEIKRLDKLWEETQKN